MWNIAMIILVVCSLLIIIRGFNFKQLRVCVRFVSTNRYLWLLNL